MGGQQQHVWRDAIPDGCWFIHCDGSVTRHPGPMGFGAVIVESDGTRHALSEAGMGQGCNNEAEARAMMAALRKARQLGARCVLVSCDSRVVVDHVCGSKMVGGAGKTGVTRLTEVLVELQAELTLFEEVRISWIPAHRNTEADALARAAAGLPPRPAPKRRKP